MENIIIVNFDVESEAYQAFTELKPNAVTENYVVSQTALAKNTEGRVAVLDGFDTGVETKNDTQMGGLIGALPVQDFSEGCNKEICRKNEPINFQTVLAENSARELAFLYS